MRRVLVGALVVTAAVGGAACSQSTKIAKPHPVTTTSIAVPAGTPVAHVQPAGAQTISAFGASGAWWPNDIVDFPPAVQQLVAGGLFGAQTLALSGYRYNIGGGGAGVSDPTRARFGRTRRRRLARGRRHDGVRERQQWTIVAWNGGAAPRALAIALPAAARSVQPDAAVHTNLNYNTAPTDKPAATRTGSWYVTVNPGSVVTYTFK